MHVYFIFRLPHRMPLKYLQKKINCFHKQSLLYLFSRFFLRFESNLL